MTINAQTLMASSISGFIMRFLSLPKEYASKTPRDSVERVYDPGSKYELENRRNIYTVSVVAYINPWAKSREAGLRMPESLIDGEQDTGFKNGPIWVKIDPDSIRHGNNRSRVVHSEPGMHIVQRGMINDDEVKFYFEANRVLNYCPYLPLEIGLGVVGPVVVIISITPATIGASVVRGTNISAEERCP
jgi:hypothetical protein